jgi:RNA polymerase sigma factor (sigma-70 family)
MNAKNTTANTGSILFLPSGIGSSKISDSTQELTIPSDAQLIRSVSCDPPDEEALGLLVNRHWGYLFAHCHMLTLDQEKARDLAQSTWYRVLRARPGLKPDGNFPAYLATIATNLFRDHYRASRRAGPMADYRLESLNAPQSCQDGESVLLVETLADTKSVQSQAEMLSAIDIDRALAKLTPQLREVLVARFIIGESCSEIGLRHRRTEQTVSGWVRQALRQMKTHLEEPGSNE